jgi:hypothetical protein
MAVALHDWHAALRRIGGAVLDARRATWIWVRASKFGCVMAQVQAGKIWTHRRPRVRPHPLASTLWRGKLRAQLLFFLNRKNSSNLGLS